MKSEFCHINLLYGTVDMKKMIEEDVSEERIADRLRKLYIPMLGLLDGSDKNEPEVIKQINIILNEWKVNKILKENICDKDKVPMGISDNFIPGLWNFGPDHKFFIDELPPKYFLPKKIDKSEQKMLETRKIPVEKYKELMIRRCCSVDKMKTSTRTKLMEDKVLFSLATPVSPEFGHKTLSDNEWSEDEDLSERITPLFNFFDAPKKETEPSEYQKLGQMNPFITLNISRLEPSILEDKPPLPLLSHPNSGDFMALLALEIVSILPKEWTDLIIDGEITLICRALSSKGLIMIKAFSFFESPPKHVMSILLDSTILSPDESIFLNFNVLEKRPYFDLIHFKINTVKGLTLREWLGRRSYVKDFPCERGFTIVFNNIEPDKNPDFRDSFKGKVLSGGIVARPVGKHGSILSFVFKAEMGGLIPTKILHEFIKTSVKNFINDIRKYCKELSQENSEEIIESYALNDEN
jgi:START domain